MDRVAQTLTITNLMPRLSITAEQKYQRERTNQKTLCDTCLAGNHSLSIPHKNGLTWCIHLPKRT